MEINLHKGSRSHKEFRKGSNYYLSDRMIMLVVNKKSVRPILILNDFVDFITNIAWSTKKLIPDLSSTYRSILAPKDFS